MRGMHSIICRAVTLPVGSPLTRHGVRRATLSRYGERVRRCAAAFLSLGKGSKKPGIARFFTDEGNSLQLNHLCYAEALSKDSIALLTDSVMLSMFS